MKNIAALTLTLMVSGCASIQSARYPESNLNCGYTHTRTVDRSAIERVMDTSWDMQQANGLREQAVLTESDKIALNSSESPDELRTIIIDGLKSNIYSHKYTFSGPNNCALKKDYGSFTETVCVQINGAQLGNNGKLLMERPRSQSFRDSITEWSINLECEGQNCAVTQRGYKTRYSIGSSFTDESKATLVVKALNKLGALCSVPN